jgi:uncharacterized protein with FMN-binding domain
MKKIALAAFVIITFLIYSFHERSQGSVVVAPSTSTKPATTTAPSSTAAYKDGNYTGTAADAFYGYIQVKATIAGGKLTDVQFLQYPNDRGTSIQINNQAMPLLKQQAIQVQTAQVDGVTGATDTSQAFIQSLGNALQQAKAS